MKTFSIRYAPAMASLTVVLLAAPIARVRSRLAAPARKSARVPRQSICGVAPAAAKAWFSRRL